MGSATQKGNNNHHIITNSLQNTNLISTAYQPQATKWATIWRMQVQKSLIVQISVLQQP
jgi:hypothetical protein